MARVDQAKITRADLTQKIATIAPEHVAPDPPHFKNCIAHRQAQLAESISAALQDECRQQYQSLKRRALGLLISSQWLVGEASARGLQAPGGSLAAKAKAAEEQLRQTLTRGEPAITQAQVSAYFRKNLERFERPQRRYLDLLERFPTEAAARRRLSEVARRGDIAHVSIHEAFDKEDAARIVPQKRAILKAIFAAKAHTLVGPLPLNEKWCFFEVTRVIPRVVKPLAQVRRAIEHQLAGERQRSTLSRFIGAWRGRWITRTDCSPGYIVQKCRQYRAAKGAEDPTAFD